MRRRAVLLALLAACGGGSSTPGGPGSSACQAIDGDWLETTQVTGTSSAACAQILAPGASATAQVSVTTIGNAIKFSSAATGGSRTGTIDRATCKASTGGTATLQGTVSGQAVSYRITEQSSGTFTNTSYTYTETLAVTSTPATAGMPCTITSSSSGTRPGGGSPAVQASCSHAGVSCTDNSGFSASDLQGNQQACQGSGGAWSTTTACATSGRVGSCTCTSGSGTAVIRLYSGSNYTEATGRQACLGGTFCGSLTASWAAG
jgi:hypothetical protein